MPIDFNFFVHQKPSDLALIKEYFCKAKKSLLVMRVRRSRFTTPYTHTLPGGKFSKISIIGEKPLTSTTKKDLLNNLEDTKKIKYL